MTAGAPLVLTDLLATGPKLRIHCQRCGMRRQYDVQAIINRVGNAMVPPLLDYIGEALARERAAVRPSRPCSRCRVVMGWPGDPTA